MEISKEMLDMFFPSELIEYFSIKEHLILGDVATKTEYLRILFEEKNELPEGYNADEYESKGFSRSKTIQDFPIRGRAVYIVLHKRRWRHKKTKKIIQRDFSFICQGAKFTSELSDFLKDTGRY
jgi:hypothetical protein